MSTTNNPFIACCGLDCEACEARLATISNDNALRAKVAKEWSRINLAIPIYIIRCKRKDNNKQLKRYVCLPVPSPYQKVCSGLKKQ